MTAPPTARSVRIRGGEQYNHRGRRQRHDRRLQHEPRQRRGRPVDRPDLHLVRCRHQHVRYGARDVDDVGPAGDGQPKRLLRPSDGRGHAPRQSCAGTYYIGGIADYANLLSESNEVNNTYNVVQVTVTAPTAQQPLFDAGFALANGAEVNMPQFQMNDFHLV